MALTVIIREQCASGPQEPALSLSLDAPRVVIGRGKGCDVILPDPTVSARHASIRLQGGANLIVDEGSTNGTLVGNVKLPPQTPRAVADGELVRVGRVWLELRFATGGAMLGSARGQARAVAMDLLARQLESDGEVMAPVVEVVSGLDQGRTIALSDPEREYVIGRSGDADIVLADPLVSRRHVSIVRAGGEWCVRDHGSTRGSVLEGTALSRAPTPWRQGAELAFGETVISFRDPLIAAFEEAMAASDVKMRARELSEPAPRPSPSHRGAPSDAEAPSRIVEAPSEGATLTDDEDDGEKPDVSATPLARRGSGMADALVALVATAVLGISLAGLWWVLG